MVICLNASFMKVRVSIDAKKDPTRGVLYARKSGTYLSVGLSSATCLSCGTVPSIQCPLGNASAVTASHYLPLAGNATDLGFTQASVFTHGNVVYGSVGGKVGAFFDNWNGNFLSVPHTFTPAVTISFWLYPTSYAWGSVFSLTNPSGGTSLQMDHGSIWVALPNGPPNHLTLYSTWDTAPTFPANVWTHVAVTVNYTSLTAQVYFNAVLVGAVKGSSFNNPLGYPQNIMTIGKAGDNPGGAYQGYVSQFVVYPTILSSSQVRQVALLTDASMCASGLVHVLGSSEVPGASTCVPCPAGIEFVLCARDHK